MLAPIAFRSSSVSTDSAPHSSSLSIKRRSAFDEKLIEPPHAVGVDRDEDQREDGVDQAVAYRYVNDAVAVDVISDEEDRQQRKQDEADPEKIIWPRARDGDDVKL